MAEAKDGDSAGAENLHRFLLLLAIAIALDRFASTLSLALSLSLVFLQQLGGIVNGLLKSALRRLIVFDVQIASTRPNENILAQVCREESPRCRRRNGGAFFV